MNHISLQDILFLGCITSELSLEDPSGNRPLIHDLDHCQSHDIFGLVDNFFIKIFDDSHVIRLSQTHLL
jgi:hypothetical protein